MRKVRWGILGNSKIARGQVIPAIMRAENAEAVAVATSSSVERANEMAKDLSIPTVYASYDDLLDDPDIDAVYLPLPNHLHKKWAIKAAEKGKHVLCEKPTALTEHEVVEIKQAFEEQQVLFMEAFMYAFHPQHERVKELIAAGDIGEVRYASASFTFYMAEEDRKNNIRMDATKGGGSMYDIGCYAIHSLRNILGLEPESIQVNGLMDPTYKVDTDVVAYLSFPNGIQASFNSSFNLPMRHEYQIFGTKGSIRVPRAFRPDVHGGEGIIMIEKADNTTIESLNGDQYRAQIEHFSEAIFHHNVPLKNDLENSIHNARVIDACYQSLKTGQKVNLPS